MLNNESLIHKLRNIEENVSLCASILLSAALERMEIGKRKVARLSAFLVEKLSFKIELEGFFPI